MKFSSLLITAIAFIFPIFQPLHGATNKQELNQSVKSVLLKVKSGDSLYSILQSQGFTSQQAGSMIAAVPKVKDLVLVPGSDYRLDTQPGLAKLRVYDPNSDVAFDFERTSNGFKSSSELQKYRIEIGEYQGKVSGSLITSIKKVLPSTKVAYRFMDAYLLEYDLRKDLQAGDSFKISVEKKFDGDLFVGFGEILKTSLAVKGRTISKRYMRYAQGGAFINLNGIDTERPFYSPVNYLSISSKFQPHRRHPITKRRQPHLGIDMVVPEGAPIMAAADGKVLRYGVGRASGHFIVLGHGQGRETYYNHMREIASNIKVGVRVRAGERIGSNGCTGYCTGAHLHFAVKINGRWKDPADLVRYYPRIAADRVNRMIASAGTTKKAL